MTTSWPGSGEDVVGGISRRSSGQREGQVGVPMDVICYLGPSTGAQSSRPGRARSLILAQRIFTDLKLRLGEAR